MNEFDFSHLEEMYDSSEQGFNLPSEYGNPFAEEDEEWFEWLPLDQAFDYFAHEVASGDRTCFPDGPEGDRQFSEYADWVPRFNAALTLFLANLAK